MRWENVLAFFELPTQPDMGRDENTPAWVQHIAFEVEDYDALLAARERVESEGLDVIGPTNHGIFQSIYFFDPNGHRLELVANTQTQEQLDELKRVSSSVSAAKASKSARAASRRSPRRRSRSASPRVAAMAVSMRAFSGS